jgi:DNA-binding MarR family transcriptional regulator
VDAFQLAAAADALGVDGEVRRTWGRLLLAHRRLTRRMDADLRAAAGSLASYDVLRQVAIAHPDGVRMSDLAGRLLLGQAGLSGRIDRLERAGQVQRSPHPDDARSMLVRLTAEGSRRLEALHAVYLRSLQREVGDRLDRDALVQLAALLDRLDPDPS